MFSRSGGLVRLDINYILVHTKVTELRKRRQYTWYSSVSTKPISRNTRINNATQLLN